MRHVRSHNLLRAVIASIAVILSSCSGPQSLELAIRSVDEKAYEGFLASTNDPSREAFYASKASILGIEIEQVRTADMALSTTKNPFEARNDPAAISRGAVIYKNECMQCHGVDVDGRGPLMPVSLPSMDFHRFSMRFAVTLHGGAPKSWFQQIKNGVAIEVNQPDTPSFTLDMPAYGDRLTREQIWLVITYLQSLDADLPKERESGDQS